MKKIFSILAFTAVLVMSFVSCKKYLDVNSDPVNPQTPDPSSVFPTQLAGIPRGLQFDARYCARFIQNWLSENTSSAANVNFDRMGYTGSSDANGDIWRQTYYGLGANLEYIIGKGIQSQQWDYVGAALVLKGMMFQYATDYHGEIIYTEAFRENQAFFKYDDQETVYRGVDSLLRLGISYLLNTDYNPNTSRLSKTDYVYAGSNAKWIKLAYGLLARNFHRLTNKSTYQPDSVIANCNRSLSVIDDDFLIPFDAQKNDDANFFGTYRNNLTVFRQSNYIVKLMNGTILAGKDTLPYRDPRMRHMLTVSSDSIYRGVDPGTGDPFWGITTGVNARKRVPVLFADSIYTNPSVSAFQNTAKKYIYGDKVVFPVMTASEIQFMKAEAAYRKGDKATALTAYTQGINLHFDFINRATFPRGNLTLFSGNPITPTERANYLTSPNVKQTVTELGLSDIMLQKYIALWGWGFFETFVDMRRFHWVDVDPVTGLKIYAGFDLPSPLSADNLNKPVYRVRPRYNSEYVWNRDALLLIGGLNPDYHTYETWMSKP
jgi:Starch-binding associating with outer membrane